MFNYFTFGLINSLTLHVGMFFVNGKYYTAQRGVSISILTNQDEVSAKGDVL